MEEASCAISKILSTNRPYIKNVQVFKYTCNKVRRTTLYLEFLYVLRQFVLLFSSIDLKIYPQSVDNLVFLSTAKNSQRLSHNFRMGPESYGIAVIILKLYVEKVDTERLILYRPDFKWISRKTNYY